MSCDASVCSRLGLVFGLVIAVVGLVSSSAACSGALQPTEQVSGLSRREQSMLSASTSAASSSAFQPTEQVSVDELQALICQVIDFKAKYGKFPIESKRNQDEKNLAQNIARNVSKFTAAQRRELKQLRDGAFQPVAEVHVVDLQALMCEVRDWIEKHGKFPTQSSGKSTDKDQNSLARKLRRSKDKLTAAQKLELQELKEGTAALKAGTIASDYFLRGENLINEVKKLGYYPREYQ